MKKINILDIVNSRQSYVDIDEFLEVKFEDDKTILMTGGDIELMLYCFRLIRLSPYKIKYLSKYCPVNFYVNDGPSSNTVNDTFEAIMVDIISEIGISNPDIQVITLEHYRVMFDIINDIFNNLYEQMATGIYGVSSRDIISISNHPKIVEARKQLEDNPNYETIKNIYTILDDLIFSDEISFDNGLKKLYVSSIGNRGQMSQLAGVRGYCNEIDSTIFKYPITESFTSGLNSLYDLGTESRTAAFSLVSSTESIKKSETLSRMLQISGVHLERLYPGDCGTTEYLRWTVRGPDDEWKGDLKNLVGSYYKVSLLENEWKAIKISDTHLIGKEIYLRNVSKCKLKDKHGVCSMCFGELSYNVPYYANIGQLTSTNLSQAASQALLSTKHHVGSAGVNKIHMDESTSKVFMERKELFYVYEDLVKTYDKVELIIPMNNVKPLLSIKTTAALSKVDIESLSKIDKLDVILKSGEKYDLVHCPIKFNGRYGLLTRQICREIVKGNYYIDSGNIVFTLDRTNIKLPILHLENKNYSFNELVTNLEGLIKKRSILKGGVSKDSIDDLIKDVFYLVNSKLNINIANISGMLYTYMTKDLPNGNFDLGRNYTSERPEVISLSNSIGNRSASASMLFDAANRELVKTSLFKDHDKPSHLYDVLFFPQERINEFKKREKYYQNYLDKQRNKKG